MINIVDNCFLCELCYDRYRYQLQHGRITTESVTALFSNLPRSRTQYIQYPSLDLQDIVMAYNIAYPAIYTFRIVFIWRRYSPPRKEPAVDYWELTYVLVYKSYRSIRFQNRLFPGSGRMHIVAEKYFKGGRADLTLLGSIPFQSHPSWCNLCLDINSVCNKYPQSTPTIFTTRPDEIYWHLCISYVERIAFD